MDNLPDGSSPLHPPTSFGSKRLTFSHFRPHRHPRPSLPIRIPLHLAPPQQRQHHPCLPHHLAPPAPPTHPPLDTRHVLAIPRSRRRLPPRRALPRLQNHVAHAAGAGVPGVPGAETGVLGVTCDGCRDGVAEGAGEECERCGGGGEGGAWEVGRGVSEVQ